MPIKYKIDVMKALKDKGYYPRRLRTEKLMGEAQIQQIRNGEIVSRRNLEVLCKLLECQPGDIIEYQKED